MIQNKKFSVLVVDDQPENIDILNDTLSPDYRVYAAKNGIKALKIVETVQPDIILLDVMMPEMDGYETCKKLKEKDNTSHIPVIFVTAIDQDVEEAKGFQIGAVDYITKPISPSVVQARVKTHLALHHQKQILESTVKAKTAELSQANKLLSNLEKTKNDFLSLISHELRTPLNSLSVVTQIFDTNNLSLEQKNMLQIVDSSTKRLLEFAEAALLVTTLNAESFNLKETGSIIPIESLITLIIDQLNSQIIKKNIQLKLSHSIPDLSVFANRDLIIKCLAIILENALKYSPEGGTIFIRSFQEENFAVIEIEDQGDGFSDSALENVFQLFYTDNILNHSKGFGLGLAVAGLIVNAHNGVIEAENNKDLGALVRLKLNICNEQKCGDV